MPMVFIAILGQSHDQISFFDGSSALPSDLTRCGPSLCLLCLALKVQALGSAPNQRFCHVACVNKDSMFVFGGYDGTSRLNDLVEFR